MGWKKRYSNQQNFQADGGSQVGEVGIVMLKCTEKVALENHCICRLKLLQL